MHPTQLFISMLAGFIFLSGCSGQGDNAGESWEQRKLRFQQVALVAQPLTAAIDRYVAEAGHPPAKLADIVPKYIEQIPATGLDDHPEFSYRSFSSRPARLVWYDLGSRHGRPILKPAKYPDGDQDHAIMILVLDSQGRIVNASIDRLPKDLDAIDFSPIKWKQNITRMKMSLKLSDAYRLDGMPTKVFEDLLGAPDGVRDIESVPWELRINCSTGFLNRDVFFYWPIQKYPQKIYSGDVEAVADWAYVHD